MKLKFRRFLSIRGKIQLISTLTVFWKHSSHEREVRTSRLKRFETNTESVENSVGMWTKISRVSCWEKMSKEEFPKLKKTRKIDRISGWWQLVRDFQRIWSGVTVSTVESNAEGILWKNASFARLH